MEIEQIFKMCGLPPGDMEEILHTFSVQKYSPDRIVFHEGDTSDKFYFIKSGQALVTRKSPNGDVEPLNVMKSGQCFGEIGIMQDIDRTATVKAIGPLELFELEREKFTELYSSSSSFANMVKQIGIRRLLKHISIFKEMDDDSLNSLLELIVEETFPGQKIIFRENDPPDALYIIIKGNVRVYKENEHGREVTLTTLTSGEFFGEQGLIDSMPRSASVATEEESKFLVIRKKEFQTLLRRNALFSFNILKVLSQRIRETSRDMSLAKSISFFKGMTIIARPEKCVSCRTCEIACAVAKSRTHNIYEAIFEEPLPVKRIRLRRDQSGSEPIVRPEHCIHCKEAPCLTACKRFGAIKRDVNTRTIAIDEEKCVGCGLCARACPFNVITMIRKENKRRVALKCTYCKEHQVGPACVRSCPTNALVVALAPNVAMDDEV